MESKIVLLLAFLFVLTQGKKLRPHPSLSETTVVPDILISSRVIGGRTAPPAVAPYLVSVRDSRNIHFCGGTILSDRWIITAAHCLLSGPPAFIVAGTNRLDYGGAYYTLKYYTAHPQYSPNTLENDIALLKTEKPIDFNRRVKPIKLPSRDTLINVPLLLTGWGKTSHPGKPSVNLQYIHLMTLNLKKCAEMMRSFNKIFQTQICTLNGPGEGACHSDSGGPLVDHNMIVGIVSWGYPCGEGYPDVFTRVYSYISWIHYVASKNQ